MSEETQDSTQKETQEALKDLCYCLLPHAFDLKNLELEWMKFMLDAIKGAAKPEELVVRHIHLLRKLGHEVNVPRTYSTHVMDIPARFWILMFMRQHPNIAPTDVLVNKWVASTWARHISLMRSISR